MKHLCSSFTLLALIMAVSPSAVAQAGSTDADPESVARSEKIIARAVEAVGGEKYLNIQTVVGRGFFTPYQEGLSQVPIRFLDYLVYPDRERTEFTTSGIRTIQTNVGDTGWYFDGATKSLHDMKPDQLENFKRSMRTSVENLLRGWWRKEGGTIRYAGRREAGLAKRNETVRLTYPDGFWIEYEFGSQDGLPAKIIYARTGKNSDTDEEEEIKEETRIARTIMIDGIAVPLIIDHFRNGVQTSRINYESVEYNRPLPDELFAKPESVKSIK